jgi:hypothetical protein
MERLAMTHNQYHKFLEENASKVWTPNNGYGMKEYNEDADRVDIIPFDLSEYPCLSSKTTEYISKHFNTEDTDRSGHRMFRGFIGDSIAAWEHEKEALKVNSHFGFYYSGYGKNEDEYIIYTWCEGDTTVTVFNNSVDFFKEVASCEEFYMNN